MQNNTEAEATFVSSQPATAVIVEAPAKTTAELEADLLAAHRKSVVTKEKLDEATKAAADLRTESQAADEAYKRAMHELAEAHRRDLKKGE